MMTIKKYVALYQSKATGIVFSNTYETLMEATKYLASFDSDFGSTYRSLYILRTSDNKRVKLKAKPEPKYLYTVTYTEEDSGFRATVPKIKPYAERDAAELRELGRKFVRINKVRVK